MKNKLLNKKIYSQLQQTLEKYVGKEFDDNIKEEIKKILSSYINKNIIGMNVTNISVDKEKGLLTMEIIKKAFQYFDDPTKDTK